MEAKPHARTLEINVISGENICVDQSSVVENVYVVVRAESLSCCSTKMVNKDKGLLTWDEKFSLYIPSHARSVTFEVQCKKYRGVRPIGVARIALSDFLGDNVVSKSCVQMFSYGLRDWDGQRNGVIHFSVRWVMQEDYASLEMKPKEEITNVNSSGFEPEVKGFQVNPKTSSNVVIGMPVWYVR
ncbi:uncharacterized protein LOC113851104 [Abrus precatorius]|uniref:Uncharacterized protein LOC113851104 n=1 Tax=Abrus precatorius TaxID=3816 RepID=A0A8B8K107_ABRPR|nr:uncharacterized protein LOC113851104 [Abrus precatorius]